MTVNDEETQSQIDPAPALRKPWSTPHLTAVNVPNETQGNPFITFADGDYSGS